MPTTHQRFSWTIATGVLASFLALTLAGRNEDEMAVTSASRPAEQPANAADPDTPEDPGATEDPAVESTITSVTGDVTTTTENTGFSMFRTAPMTCAGDTIDVDVTAGIVH